MGRGHPGQDGDHAEDDYTRKRDPEQYEVDCVFHFGTSHPMANRSVTNDSERATPAALSN